MMPLPPAVLSLEKIEYYDLKYEVLEPVPSMLVYACGSSLNQNLWGGWSPAIWFHKPLQVFLRLSNAWFSPWKLLESPLGTFDNDLI